MGFGFGFPGVQVGRFPDSYGLCTRQQRAAVRPLYRCVVGLRQELGSAIYCCTAEYFRWTAVVVVMCELKADLWGLAKRWFERLN